MSTLTTPGSPIIVKEVMISKISTLADGSIRLQVDLLDGTDEDIKNAYQLKFLHAAVILAPKADIIKPDTAPTV